MIDKILYRYTSKVQAIVQISRERVGQVTQKSLFRNILSEGIKIACEPLATKTLEQYKTTLKNELISEPLVSLYSRYDSFKSKDHPQFICRESRFLNEARECAQYLPALILLAHERASTYGTTLWCTPIADAR